MKIGRGEPIRSLRGFDGLLFPVSAQQIRPSRRLAYCLTTLFAKDGREDDFSLTPPLRRQSQQAESFCRRIRPMIPRHRRDVSAAFFSGIS